MGYKLTPMESLLIEIVPDKGIEVEDLFDLIFNMQGRPIRFKGGEIMAAFWSLNRRRILHLRQDRKIGWGDLYGI